MFTLPSVVLTPRELDFMTPSLEDAYRVLKLWEKPDAKDIAEARALISVGNRSPEDLVARMPALGLLACFTAGYDGIDVKSLNERGIQVSHSPDVSGEAVAEFAMALILAAYRNVVLGERHLREGKWVKDGEPMFGKPVYGSKIGIVGLGAIGRALGRRCEAFGMTVSWWGPRPKADAAWPRVDTLEALAQQNDILAVCAAAHADNVGLISSAVIEALGPEGLLVNVARGQLVDEDALIDALKAKRLGGAALDVFVTEPTPPARWADVPNVVLTPHIGGASYDSLSRMAALVRVNLDAFFAGRQIPNPAGQ